MAPVAPMVIPVKLVPRDNIAMQVWVPLLDTSVPPLTWTCIRFDVEVGVIACDGVATTLTVEVDVPVAVALAANGPCTISPGFFIPGPNGCKVVQADAHAPAVASPEEKSQ